MQETKPEKSAWRFYPLAIAAGLGLVVLVNIGMVYLAEHTFPGEVAKDAGETGLTATAPVKARPQ